MLASSPPRVGSARSVRYRVFLERLRRARTMADMTQEYVARALGRPQSFVAKCESGERRIDVVESAFSRCLIGDNDIMGFSDTAGNRPDSTTSNAALARLTFGDKTTEGRPSARATYSWVMSAIVRRSPETLKEYPITDGATEPTTAAGTRQHGSRLTKHLQRSISQMGYTPNLYGGAALRSA